MKDIDKHVQSIADSITNPPEAYEDEYGETKGDAFDWLADALDIEYVVNSNREFLGARVLVAFGGPNIWVNTRTNTIEGYWWADSATARFEDNLGLNDALETLYKC
jgi:hypothetical protein